MLLKSAKVAGVNLVVNAEGVEIRPVTSGDNSKEGQELVRLKDGRQYVADAVVGADGLWSICRDYVLEKTAPPQETGQLAFRGTFSREQLLAFDDL